MACIECDGTGYSIQNLEGRFVSRPCAACSHAVGVPRPLWLARKEMLFENQAQLFGLLSEWIRKPLWSAIVCAPNETANVGTGKSFVLATIANELNIMGVDVLYASMWAIIDEREDKTRPTLDAYRGIMLSQYAGVLVLDEFGIENAIERESVERMLRSRYERRFRTLLATNLDWPTIETTYPRIASALTEGVVVRWGGPDIRPSIARMKLKQHEHEEAGGEYAYASR